MKMIFSLLLWATSTHSSRRPVRWRCWGGSVPPWWRGWRRRCRPCTARTKGSPWTRRQPPESECSKNDGECFLMICKLEINNKQYSFLWLWLIGQGHRMESGWTGNWEFVLCPLPAVCTGRYVNVSILTATYIHQDNIAPTCCVTNYICFIYFMCIVHFKV